MLLALQEEEDQHGSSLVREEENNMWESILSYDSSDVGLPPYSQSRSLPARKILRDIQTMYGRYRYVLHCSCIRILDTGDCRLR
jgi:hypothetical protein